MSQVWLEVALNGPWGRDTQPGIPVDNDELVADGIACARAGAAIIHVHVYDPATGRQKDDAEAYRAVIEGIRDQVDVIVYPSIPLSGSPDSPRLLGPSERFAATEALGRAGLIEWAVVDPGSETFATYADIAQDSEGHLYLNPEAHIRHGIALGQTHGFHPSFAIYEPGFLRLGAALSRRYLQCPNPIYRFMFSDGFAFGFPPRPYGLEAYLKLLEEVTPGAPWMVAGLNVDIRPLIEPAVARGGHVRVGLEDAPFGSDMTNLQWTEEAVALIGQAGGTLATAPELRQSLSAVAAPGQ